MERYDKDVKRYDKDGNWCAVYKPNYEYNEFLRLTGGAQCC
jgi:hypothetical protein